MLATLLMIAATTITRTSGHAENQGQAKRSVASDRWEYLVVSGASSTNFAPTDNADMRKESGGFGRESFVLEQHLDRLGLKGWELVSVSGPAADPVYYFKRRK